MDHDARWFIGRFVLALVAGGGLAGGGLAGRGLARRGLAGRGRPGRLGLARSGLVAGLGCSCRFGLIWGPLKWADWVKRAG